MAYTEFWEHITKEGERWDTIAYNYYGDATQYEPIITANPYVAIKPVFTAGLKLQIPVIEQAQKVKTEGLPPWVQ